MKEITILAFGSITDIIRNSNFLTNAASTDELRNELESAFPKLKTINYAMAVNKQVVTTSVILDAHATVALLPPFSGG